MEVDIKGVSTATTILPHESLLVSLVDGILHRNSLIIELPSNINITSSRIHRPSNDNTALNQLVRILPHDLPVLARPRLALICIDNQVPWPGIFLPPRLVHETELHATWKACSSPSAQARCLDFTDQPAVALEKEILCAVPVAHFLC